MKNTASRAKVIAIANQKGGVGKTTITRFTVYIFAERGKCKSEGKRITGHTGNAGDCNGKAF